MNDETIEQLLRKAPRVPAPETLRDELERNIELPVARPLMNHQRPPAPTAWIRRWLPAISFGVWFLVCTVVFAVQAVRISELREQNRLRETAEKSAAEQLQAADGARAAAAAELEQLRRNLADVQRLRVEVDQLRTEAAELATLRTQNQQLRDELKAQGKLPVKPEEDFFAVTMERAERTRCINNLKQVCLAARMWANDHGDTLPVDYESMKKELANEKITFCPRDGTSRYEMLSPGVNERQPEVVYVRCVSHNIVGMVDGSVQQLADARQVVQRNGKWILVRNEFE
jgi:hypothetical protein